MSKDNSLEKPSILKPGANIVIETVDMDDPEVKRSLEELHTEQGKIAARKKIDFNSDWNLVITI